MELIIRVISVFSLFVTMIAVSRILYLKIKTIDSLQNEIERLQKLVKDSANTEIKLRIQIQYQADQLQFWKNEAYKLNISNQRYSQSTYNTSIDFFSGCANEEERKRRFKQLTVIYHPDNNKGNSQLFMTIKNQYERR